MGYAHGSAKVCNQQVRYKNTNCYFVSARGGLLAFDAGWPGTYRAYKDGLREQGWSVKDVRWLLVSHFHLDHAGLAGISVENGVEFVVFPGTGCGSRGDGEFDRAQSHTLPGD